MQTLNDSSCESLIKRKLFQGSRNLSPGLAAAATLPFPNYFQFKGFLVLKPPKLTTKNTYILELSGSVPRF